MQSFTTQFLKIFLLLIPISGFSQVSFEEKMENQRNLSAEYDMVEKEREKSVARWKDLMLDFKNGAEIYEEKKQRNAEKKLALVTANTRILESLVQKYLIERTRNVESKYNLARLIISGRYPSGNLSAKYDFKSAWEDLKSLALAGHPAAMYEVGKLYVDYGDTARGNSLIRSAAQKGDASADIFLSGNISRIGGDPNRLVFVLPELKKIAATRKSSGQRELLPPVRELIIQQLPYLANTQFVFLKQCVESCPPLANAILDELKEFYSKPAQFAKRPIHPVWLMMAYLISSKSSLGDELIGLQYEAYINECRQQGTLKSFDLKILGDFYSASAWAAAGKNPYISSKQDLTKAVACFTEAATMGHVGAAYKLGLGFKYGYLANKDTLKALQYLQDASTGGMTQAFTEQADILAFGGPNIVNSQKAAEFYLRAIQQKQYYEGYLGLIRMNTDIIRDIHPLVKTTHVRNMMDEIANDMSPIVVLHFTQGNVDEEDYSRTAALIQQWGKDRKVHLLLATTHRTDIDTALVEGMGYRGIYYLLSHSRSERNTDVYTKFESKLMMRNPYDYERLILTKKGDIFPEFDERWKNESFPSTFIYRKTDSQSAYFDANATFEEVNSYILKNLQLMK